MNSKQGKNQMKRSPRPFHWILGNQSRKIRRPVIASAVLLIVVIAVVYMIQLNQTVSDNIIQNISELSEHDQNSIQSYVVSTWTKLEYLEGKFISYGCKNIREIQEQMNVERSNSTFSSIYLVDADGKIYTDTFMTYQPEKDGVPDLLSYFVSGENRVVERFRDSLSAGDANKESILYGIRLKDFSVNKTEMVALVGVTDIREIQDRLTINSFYKNGVSRGYGAVIDAVGNYIVDVDRTIYVNDQTSFFEKIDNSRKSELTSGEIAQKMEAGETFSFTHTSAEGEERIVYCMPFEEEGLHWYFFSSVESTVFSEQNHRFLIMSMAMLISIVVVILLVLVFVLRSQKKLFQANAEARARSIFLANMSHEIRTPLNGIIGLIFLMEKDLKNGAEKSLVKQRLQKAKATAEYLLSLINNILDISKLQAGKVELNQEPLSLEVLLDDILSMQKSSIESRKIHFVVNKEITVPWIIGDNLMIKQVLLNILSNAAKFTPPEGQITFSVEQMREEERRVTTVFTCADTGCGMSEEFQKHIWDSFTQERKKNENSIKGTGLGMAISRLLMQAMGGEIEVQSRLGMGSTFYVILHSEIALQSPEYRIVQKEIQRSDPSQNEKMRILVAEDNELNAEILLEILQSEGYETTYACNGQEAVEKFEQSAPGEIQVILMDMQMPLMDGCEATKEIRSLDRPDAATVLIFACTANNFNEDRERAEACGMNDFLSKPIDVKEMFMKLGRSS